jgi:hypothetical protein
MSRRPLICFFVASLAVFCRTARGLCAQSLVSAIRTNPGGTMSLADGVVSLLLRLRTLASRRTEWRAMGRFVT